MTIPGIFRFGIVVLPLALAACVSPYLPPVGTVPPDDPLPMENVCGAAGMQDLIGQSGEKLNTIRFGVPIRIIRPGMAVTMDYSPNRLNIYIDDFDRITAVKCG